MHPTAPIRILLASLIAVTATSFSAGQLAYISAGSTLTETFANPAGWGTGNMSAQRWMDNRTIPGWYAAYYVAASDTYTTPPTIVRSNGTQTTNHSFYIFRDPSDEEIRQDGALGAIPLNAQTAGPNQGGVFYGVQIRNETSKPLTEFTLGYVMEIWRLSRAARPNSLAVSYRIGGDTFGSGTWTAIPSLTLTSPAGPESGTTLLNGNLDENRLSASATVTGVTIPPGESIWIRWYDNNDPGIDNGIGIDEVTFSAKP